MRLVRRPPARRRVRGVAAAGEFEGAVSEFFMRLALREAQKGQGRTSPNPAVGALLVRGGRVIARGHHARAGGPHAEVVALTAAGARARGADLYTTLEPCDHTGRTPPCAAAILAAGVRQVFVGSSDPNPLVSGKGVRRLRRAGVPVVTGVLRSECDRLNDGWFRFIRDGRSAVTLKVAATLDGRIARASGAPRYLTSGPARALVHELRDRVDAVLVGRGTVEVDDPLLTTRLPGGKGRDPARVVVDSKLRTSPRARLFSASPASCYVACVAPAPAARRRRLEAAGAEVIECKGRGGRVDLQDLVRKLAARGIVELLVEGGAEIFGGFLEAGLADRLLLFFAPKVFGAGPAWAAGLPAAAPGGAPALEIQGARMVGPDLLVEAIPATVVSSRKRKVAAAPRAARSGRRQRS